MIVGAAGNFLSILVIVLEAKKRYIKVSSGVVELSEMVSRLRAKSHSWCRLRK